MTLELSKRDLVSLVKGVEPHYDVMDNFIVKKCGSYIGGFNDRWVWSPSNLNELTEHQLLHLYILCRDSWSFEI